MLKIAIGMSSFLEYENLKITLPQLKETNCRGLLRFTLIIVDGKYKGFAYPTRYSDDGSLELLKKKRNVILIKKSANQIDKRNEYMRYARLLKYDFLLVMDADWDIDIDWKVFGEELKRLKNDTHIAYNIEFWNSTEQWPFALLYKPNRVEYHKIHHVLRCRRCHFEIDTTKQHTDNIKGIALTHRISKRSERYEVAKRDYQNWKLYWENKLRKKRGMKEIRMFSA